MCWCFVCGTIESAVSEAWHGIQEKWTSGRFGKREITYSQRNPVNINVSALSKRYFNSVRQQREIKFDLLLFINVNKAFSTFASSVLARRDTDKPMGIHSYVDFSAAATTHMTTEKKKNILYEARENASVYVLSWAHLVHSSCGV